MTLFLRRLLVNITSFLFIQLPLQLIGAVVLLVYLPYHRKHSLFYKLPKGLRWFDCADLYIGRDVSTYQKIYNSDFLTHYLWLAWRNPINYFEYVYLGARVLDITDYRITVKPSDLSDFKSDIGNQSSHIDGFKYVEMRTRNSYYDTSKIYYEYLYVKKYAKNKCFYFRMGHKIKNSDNKPGSYIQHVFTISPFKLYEGK